MNPFWPNIFSDGLKLVTTNQINKAFLDLFCLDPFWNNLESLCIFSLRNSVHGLLLWCSSWWPPFLWASWTSSWPCALAGNPTAETWRIPIFFPRVGRVSKKMVFPNWLKKNLGLDGIWEWQTAHTEFFFQVVKGWMITQGKFEVKKGNPKSSGWSYFRKGFRYLIWRNPVPYKAVLEGGYSLTWTKNSLYRVSTWVFPTMGLTYSLYKRWVPPFLGEHVGDSLLSIVPLLGINIFSFGEGSGNAGVRTL